MAKRNQQNQNPDRSPSGKNPSRRRDNANQGTEGGRSSSRKPGTELPDAGRQEPRGGRGEAPEKGGRDEPGSDRPEKGVPAELDRGAGNRQETVERQ